MAHLEDYSYSPLPEGYIRLLHIDLDGSSVGHLEITSLDDARPFYALSHSWGTKLRDVPVQIDGQMLYITSDVAAGIRRLQELARDSKLDPPVAYVWIDSICINQQDKHERSQQVALSGKIYSQSERTLIWLGPQEDSDSTAWQLLDHICDMMEPEHQNTSVLYIPEKIYSSFKHAQFKLPAWDDKPWTKLWQLLQLSWFSRIWVVQEVVRSPKDPIFLHGKEIYSWHNLERAANWMRRNGYLRRTGVPEQLRNVITMGTLRRQVARWPLDALLSITQIKFHATDQRDKIYGLLSLAVECQETIPELLHPDYDSDVGQVYQRVARFLLENKSLLAILTRTRETSDSLTRNQRQYEFEIPSWTPDWSDFLVFNNKIRTSFSWVHYSDSTIPPRLGFPDHYTASGDREPRLHDSGDPSILRLGGTKVDDVNQTIRFTYFSPDGPPSKEDFGDQLGYNILSMWDIALPLLMNDNVTDLATRFIRVTTADHHGLIGRNYDQNLKDGFAYLLGLSLSFEEYKNGEELKYMQQLSAGGDPEQYAVLARNYCFDRTFIVTSTGKMGIGPSDTQEGDCVCVLFGGGVPYVIRDKANKYEFVGELYLEGFMGGEAIQALDRGDVKEEIFDFI